MKGRLWIASPYFVPESGIVHALQLASMRGVDVRILIPDKSDNPMADMAAASFFEEMERQSCIRVRFLSIVAILLGIIKVRTLPGKIPSLRLAARYGRYGYRRVHALLQAQGWQVSHGRVLRIWRREGLKVPHKQPKRSRLWLNDGSCIRLRPPAPETLVPIEELPNQIKAA